MNTNYNEYSNETIECKASGLEANLQEVLNSLMGDTPMDWGHDPLDVDWEFDNDNDSWNWSA